jgi:hypothetical protein
MFRLSACALLVNGACTRPPLVSRDLGAECSTDFDCTHRCLPRTTWPGGFCTRSCASDLDCPAGASCADAVCLYACFDDADCHFLSAGWSCRTLAGALVCAPELPDAGPAHES